MRDPASSIPPLFTFLGIDRVAHSAIANTIFYPQSIERYAPTSCHLYCYTLLSQHWIGPRLSVVYQLKNVEYGSKCCEVGQGDAPPSSDLERWDVVTLDMSGNTIISYRTFPLAGSTLRTPFLRPRSHCRGSASFLAALALLMRRHRVAWFRHAHIKMTATPRFQPHLAAEPLSIPSRSWISPQHTSIHRPQRP